MGRLTPRRRALPPVRVSGLEPGSNAHSLGPTPSEEEPDDGQASATHDPDDRADRVHPRCCVRRSRPSQITVAPRASAASSAVPPSLPSTRPSLGPVAMDLPARQRLTELIAGWRSRNDVPGVVFGMRLGDGEPLIVVDGEDVDSGAPLPADGVFEIASITKTFTGALALDLIDAGKLGLDDPIEAYVKGFPERRPDHHPPPAHAHERPVSPVDRGRRHAVQPGDDGPRIERPRAFVHARRGARAGRGSPTGVLARSGRRLQQCQHHPARRGDRGGHRSGHHDSLQRATVDPPRARGHVLPTDRGMGHVRSLAFSTMAGRS